MHSTNAIHTEPRVRTLANTHARQTGTLHDVRMPSYYAQDDLNLLRVVGHDAQAFHHFEGGFVKLGRDSFGSLGASLPH